MTASYPSAVKNNFSTKVDLSTTVLAAHVNDLQDEVTAIETYVGANPHITGGWVGSFDQVTTTWNTVKDRIQNIEYGLGISYSARIPTGGTTGQALVKNSNSNYDVTWSTVSGGSGGGEFSAFLLSGC